MATDAEFLIHRLTPAARRHIRVFQIHQLLDRFAMGLTVAVVALALTDRGLDIAQISLLFGIYSLTTMVAEVPFGGLADTIGRKPVFLAAVGASLISLLLFLSSSDFFILALSFAFIGFGRALRSGTLDAWFVETFRTLAANVDIQPALAKAHGANAVGLAFGAIVGGILPDIFGAAAGRLGLSAYDVSYIASFVMMVGLLIYTILFISDAPRPLTPTALRQGFAEVPMVLRKTSALAFRHATLSLLLLALALFLMATNPVEVIWPTVAKPMLADGYANAIIGVLTATYFFSIAMGAALSPHLSRLFKRRHTVTLAVAFGGLAVVQIALAMQGSVVGFVAVFILYALFLGVSETPASSMLHAVVEDAQRSTLLSLRSLIQQLGGAIGMVFAGALAENYSTSSAWMAGAVFLGIAMVLMLVLAAKMRAS